MFRYYRNSITLTTATFPGERCGRFAGLAVICCASWCFVVLRGASWCFVVQKGKRFVNRLRILSQFFGVFAFQIDPPGKPKFDVDQIDRPVLASQFLVQLADPFPMQFNILTILRRRILHQIGTLRKPLIRTRQGFAPDFLIQQIDISGSEALLLDRAVSTVYPSYVFYSCQNVVFKLLLRHV